MLIVPFIHKITNVNDMIIHVIRILTIGGNELWEESNELWEESNEIDNILELNDIYYKNIIRHNNLYLYEVDIEKTDINDIYKWSDINMNDTTFCWKDYVFFIGKKNENWLNHLKNEKIGNIYVNDFLKLIGI